MTKQEIYFYVQKKYLNLSTTGLHFSPNWSLAGKDEYFPRHRLSKPWPKGRYHILATICYLYPLPTSRCVSFIYISSLNNDFVQFELVRRKDTMYMVVKVLCTLESWVPFIARFIFENFFL